MPYPVVKCCSALMFCRSADQGLECRIQLMGMVLAEELM